MSNKILEQAIHYADNGFHIFPCVPYGKKPLTKNGFHDATTDQEQIEEWWEANPNANIGIATEGLVVIDIDGADNSWLRGNGELYTKLSDNAVCVTPRGGAHYWFSQLPEHDIKSSVSKVAPNVDVRANGGYVVVPPSYVIDEEHGIDGKYQWVYPQILGNRNELSPIPQWLYEMVSGDKSATAPEDFNLSIIQEGRRNQSLARIAGVVRRIGCNESEIRSLLRAINWQRCDPPLENTEVDTIARSVSRYPPNNASAAYAECWDLVEEELQEEEQINPGFIPDDLFNVPGLIGDVMAFNDATAYRRQPELALAGALCLMAVLTGRKIEDNYRTRTNLYAFAVAASGSGKEHARKINKDILAAIGAEELIGPEGFASHAGIVSVVETSPVKLFQTDELGRLLQTLNNPGKSPHLYGIITVLLKLYTSADSQFVGDAYADVKKIKKIDQPHVVLYGTTVPESFFDGLTHESLSDGFLSRSLTFFARDNNPPPTGNERQEIPQGILDQAAAWWNHRPGGNLSGHTAQPDCVAMAPEAHEIFRELAEQCRGQINKAGDYATLWTRVEEKARTLAILYACSRDGTTPTVDEDAASWGATLVEHLTHQFTYAAQNWITRGQHDAAVKSVLRAITDAGPNGITRTLLCRKFQHLRARELNDIIGSLIDDTMQVQEHTISGNLGRNTRVYTARKRG